MLGVVINFCTNDYPFLPACIAAVKPFSSQILVPVCDHFFDGVAEERAALNGSYAAHLDVNFIEFPYANCYYAAHPPAFWHNLSRLIGSYFLDSKIEYVLFLDCDEIVETERFIAWLNTCCFRAYTAMTLANYWYFRDACYQAAQREETAVFVRKDQLTAEALMSPFERKGIFTAIAGKKKRGIAASSPLIHHYSWVRSYEQMMRKVRSWGHRGDRDWEAQVEREFSHPFEGTDFVHGYTFSRVSPFVDIDLSLRPPYTERTNFTHVRYLSEKEVKKIDLCLTYNLCLQTRMLT